MDFQDFPKGSRVVFTRDAERFPFFIVPKGTTAEVIESTEHGVWAHVEQDVPGLSDSVEWTGDFMWTPEEWMAGQTAPFEVERPTASA